MAGQTVLTFPEVPTAPQCRAFKKRLPATKQVAGSAENFYFILFHCPLDGMQFNPCNCGANSVYMAELLRLISTLEIPPFFPCQKLSGKVDMACISTMNILDICHALPDILWTDDILWPKIST